MGISVQEKKFKIDFQDDGHGGHLGFLIGTMLTIFDLQVALIFPSIGLWVQEKFKIDFQDGHHDSHFRFLIGPILAISDLQIALILPTKFQINWPFCSREKFKIDFQDGSHL